MNNGARKSKNLRKDPTSTQKERLFAQNASMCCVCKAFNIGLELHHIDGDRSNTVDSNLAVLCVSDHDAHHRPGRYRARHTELDASAITQSKRNWEEFVAESDNEKPQLLVTVSGFGTLNALHSVKSVYQWTDGRIAFERLYHVHSGMVDDWTTEIVAEAVRLGRHIPIALFERPYDVELCPCCHNSLSPVVDRGYGIRLTAENWDNASCASIYANPNQPSLAVDISLADRSVFALSLHLCNGKYLHIVGDDYEERLAIRPQPSVRTQATLTLQELLRDWRPAHVFIGTGDPDRPQLVDNMELPRDWSELPRGWLTLPRCWEELANTANI